jgi:hypothetical protein
MDSIPKKPNNHIKGDAPWRFKKGQKTWNQGTGGCKKGHDPSLYVPMADGIKVCLGCKRINGEKYRKENQKKINLSNRVKRYDIDIDTFYGMYDAQNGKCGICGSEIDLDTCRIDHNHKTGKVRGILCAACNTGIGLLKDSDEVLLNAVNYLRKTNE